MSQVRGRFLLREEAAFGVLWGLPLTFVSRFSQVDGGAGGWLGVASGLVYVLFSLMSDLSTTVMSWMVARRDRRLWSDGSHLTHLPSIKCAPEGPAAAQAPGELGGDGLLRSRGPCPARHRRRADLAAVKALAPDRRHVNQQALSTGWLRVHLMCGR